MRGRYFKLAAALALLASGAAAYTVAGLHLYGQYRVTYADFRGACGALVTWSPPAEIYTAFYANTPTLVTVQYRSPVPASLRITLGIPGFTQDQSVEVQASPDFRQQAFKPPLLTSTVLDALVGPRQRDAQIHLHIQSAKSTLCDTSIPVVLESRQWMHWYDPSSGNNAKFLAGWVTPQDTVIAGLVGQAARQLAANPEQYPRVTSLNGYDQGRASADSVRGQVDAIFDTLQFTYHVHYAEDNVPYAVDADQLIQLPSDVLAQPAPTAMCLETTAIMASAVERLGMRSYFIIVPGHAFLGVALGDAPGAGFEYWETSDLNGGVLGSQANVHGDAEYNTYNQQGQVLDVIDVQYERSLGIEPIE